MSATTTLDIPVSIRKGEFLPEIAKILLLSFSLYIHLFSPETGDLLTKDHVSIDLFGKRILEKRGRKLICEQRPHRHNMARRIARGG